MKIKTAKILYRQRAQFAMAGPPAELRKVKRDAYDGGF
jgi:hypothetical protein